MKETENESVKQHEGARYFSAAGPTQSRTNERMGQRAQKGAKEGSLSLSDGTIQAGIANYCGNRMDPSPGVHLASFRLFSERNKK